MFERRGISWAPARVSPVRYLTEAGALAPSAPTLAVHCVHVDHDDAALLAAQGVAVAHCPKSNGKLGAGGAPLRLLLDAGLPVGLGTDSVASNNAADLWEEMRAALFLARARAGDAGALGAGDVLGLATLGGARALGKEAEIGSLTPNKRADLCVVDLRGLHLFPACEDDPVAALVYGARAADTLMTMVDGRVIYERYERASSSGIPARAGVPSLDLDALRTKVALARRRLRRSADEQQLQQAAAAAREKGIGA
jgi:5-methylthioadenosine/S-adenosylhomocysteine deaminase